MTRVVFLSKGSDSASTRYRATDFFPALRSLGIEAQHIDVSGSVGNYLAALSAAREADVVIVLRKTFSTVFRILLRRSAKRLLFDFDDAIFCNSDGSASPTRMRRFAAMVQSCDYVLAGNSFLAKAAARFNPAVTVLPTSVDIVKYGLPAPKPADMVDLVWIGSSSTRKYLESALPALEAASQLIPNLRLKIIADFTLRSEILEIDAIRWSEETEAFGVASAHIGIAPMIDNDWTRGKCGLKVLQYMAAGLPVVSSNAGVNAEIVQHEETGLLVSSESEWVQAIQRLAQDEVLRQRLGHAGQMRVKESYAQEAALQCLLQVIRKIA